MPFKIYKDDDVVVEGGSPLTITGLEPNTDVAKGEYQAVRVEDGEESERVDIPSFKTLPIDVTGVSISPKTSTATAGESGSRKLDITIEPENATNKDYEIAVDVADGAIQVDTDGNLKWTEDLPAGTYETTVTTDDGGFTDTHVLTLEEPEPEPEPEEPDPEEGD